MTTDQRAPAKPFESSLSGSVHQTSQSTIPALTDAATQVLLRQEQIEQLAHDLLNPLTVLKAVSQSILGRLRDGLPVERKRLESGMRDADDAVTRAVAEIDRFLETARRSRPALVLPFLPLDFTEVVEAAVADCRHVTTSHTFVVITSEVALIGPGERGLLLHAFDNILRNAIKYSPDGGTITVSLQADGEGDAQYALIAIRDEGIGIPAASLPRIFDRFFRAENVADTPGTGLGLTGTLRIAEAHHGTLLAESVEGKGCVFTLRLPLIPVQLLS